MNSLRQIFSPPPNKGGWFRFYANIPILVLCVMVSVPVAADDLFTLTGTVINGNQTQNGSYSANSIEDLANTLDNAGLTNVFGESYNHLYSEVNVTLNVRGLPATASYAANSTTLVFSVPSLGITETFTGATRDESQSLFEDFLKGNGRDIITKMLQKLAEVSPVDPVAGNPNSLQGLMSANTFGVGSGIGEISEYGSTSTTKAIDFAMQPNLAAAGGDIGVADSGGFNSFVVTLPLRYSFYLDDPRYALTIDAPLTYVNTEGAQTGTGSLGLAFRMPVLKNWYLTPSIRGGATGSVDLGAAALMYSGDITSSYSIYAGDFKINIGNGIGYYKTSELSVGDVSLDYDLTNTALKNGVSIEAPLSFTMLGRPTSWQAYIIDTQMFGDKLYLEHYDEIGVLMGTRQSMDSQSWDSFRMGLSFTFGDDYKALKANFNYRF